MGEVISARFRVSSGTIWCSTSGFGPGWSHLSGSRECLLCARRRRSRGLGITAQEKWCFAMSGKKVCLSGKSAQRIRSWSDRLEMVCILLMWLWRLSEYDKKTTVLDLPRPSWVPQQVYHHIKWDIPPVSSTSWYIFLGLLPILS